MIYHSTEGGVIGKMVMLVFKRIRLRAMEDNLEIKTGCETASKDRYREMARNAYVVFSVHPFTAASEEAKYPMKNDQSEAK